MWTGVAGISVAKSTQSVEDANGAKRMEEE